MDRPTEFQQIFLSSPANGAVYRGETLPINRWEWPKDTWLQQRLRRQAMRKDEPRPETAGSPGPPDVPRVRERAKSFVLKAL